MDLKDYGKSDIKEAKDGYEKWVGEIRKRNCLTHTLD